MDADLGDSNVPLLVNWCEVTPSLIDSKVLIANQKGIISIIDANNGTEIDTLNLDELSIPPIPIDGHILFLTAKGKLLAYK